MKRALILALALAGCTVETATSDLPDETFLPAEQAAPATTAAPTTTPPSERDDVSGFSCAPAPTSYGSTYVNATMTITNRSSKSSNYMVSYLVLAAGVPVFNDTAFVNAVLPGEARLVLHEGFSDLPAAADPTTVSCELQEVDRMSAVG